MVDFLNDEHRERFVEARAYMQTSDEKHLCMLYMLTGCNCLDTWKINRIIDQFCLDYDSMENCNGSKDKRTKRLLSLFHESAAINMFIQQAIYFGYSEMYLCPDEEFAYRLDSNNQAALLGGLVLYHFYNGNLCRIDHIHSKGNKPTEFDYIRFS